jgi:hypothetical protein
MINFLKNAPQGLKTFRELFDYAVNLYKQRMGVFPEGIDKITIQRQAANLAEDRQKIVKFPGGGKDKTDPFVTRPDPRVKQPKGAKMDVQRANENLAGGANYAEGDTKYNADILADEIARMRGAERENLPIDDQIKLYGEAYDYLTQFNRLNKKATGEFGITVLDDAGKPVKTTTGESPESLMNKLVEMTNQNLKDRGLGSIKLGDKIPPPKNKKPAVDPKLQKSEDQKQMFLDFENRNKTRPGKINYDKMGEFLGVKLRGDETFDELLEIEKNLGKPKKADGGRIGFKNAGLAGDPMEGDRFAMAQPQEPGPMGPVFETGDIGAAAKEVMTRMAGPSSLLNIPMGRGFGLDFGLGARRSIDAGISFNPQNPNFNLQLGVGALQGKPVIGAQFSKPLSGGMFGLGKKDGGRIGFKEGTPKDPSKRNFIKLMGGLAAFPFVGKFFKPAAKVAKTAGPAVAEGVKLGYDKFLMLVDKIKRLGRKTDGVTQKEREVGYTYQGKDGSEYELVEDLTTGDVRITKDRPGVAVANRGMDDVEGVEVIDDRSTFVLKKGEDVVDPKKKKVIRTQDEYDEMRELPDQDGTFTDIDEVSDNTVNEILEELGETRIKKASGGLAYMLGE